MSAAVSLPVTAVCQHCGDTFATDSAWGRRTCSEACRKMRETLRTRERNREWCAEHRACRRPNAWLSGAPPFGDHLPGGAMSLAFDPAPKWPIALRNTRALHGLMTTLLNEGHGRLPLFALRMTSLSPSGWGVYWWHEAGKRLASTTHDAELYGRDARVTLGPLVRLRAPIVARRGRRRLRVDTVTPLTLIPSTGAHGAVRPSTTSLRATLGFEWLQRLGVGHALEGVRIDVVSSDREQQTPVDLGGKYGTVLGWEGSFVVEANAPGHWLLETAARVGLGSRTAFGLGQIRVTEIDR